MKYPSKQTKS